MLNLDAITKFVKNLTLEGSFKNLITVYKKLNDQRKELDADVKKYKALEETLKTLLSNKLTAENLESVRTDVGVISNKITTTIKSPDIEAFIAWIGEDFYHRKHLFKDSCYSIPKVKDEFIDDLPPGLELLKIKQLSITKK